MHCRHHDGVRGNLAQHRFLAPVRLGAERRALEHLAEVVRVVFGKAMMKRRRRKHAAVAAPPADDHVGALLEQLDEWMYARHRDYPLRGVELGFGQCRVALEPQYDLAGAHAASQVLATDLGVEVADLEFRQLMLRGKLPDDVHEEVDAAVGAGVAGRPDDHRHAQLPRGEQHVLQILGLPGERTGRGVGAERNRTDVVATGVGRDVVGTRRDAAPKALDPDGGESQVPVGADDAQRMHDSLARGCFGRS